MSKATLHFVHFSCIIILIKSGTVHNFGYSFYSFPRGQAELLFLQCKYKILPYKYQDAGRTQKSQVFLTDFNLQ